MRKIVIVLFLSLLSLVFVWLVGLTANCIWLTLETRGTAEVVTTTQDNLEKIQDLPVIKSAINQLELIEELKSAIYEGLRGDIEKKEQDLLAKINATDITLANIKRELQERLSAIEKRLNETDIQEVLTELSGTKTILSDIMLKLNTAEDTIEVIKKDINDVSDEIGEAKHDIDHLQEDAHAHDGAASTFSLQVCSAALIHCVILILVQ